MFVHMCVCEYVHTGVCVSVCVNVCSRAYVRQRGCMHMRVHKSVHTRAGVFLYVCVRLHVWVCSPGESRACAYRLRSFGKFNDELSRSDTGGDRAPRSFGEPCLLYITVSVRTSCMDLKRHQASIATLSPSLTQALDHNVVPSELSKWGLVGPSQDPDVPSLLV